MDSIPEHWLVGKRIGYLLVMSQLYGPNALKKRAEFMCKCICGNDCIRHYNSLKIAHFQGMKSSCGCRGKATTEQVKQWYDLMMSRTLKKMSELQIQLAEQKTMQHYDISRVHADLENTR